MKDHEKRFETVFEEMKLYFPMLVDKMVDWYPSGQLEITVKLEDGSKVAYSSITKGIRTIRNSDGIPEDMDEKRWRESFKVRLYKKLYMTNMNQEELAEKTGISPVMISKYMSEKATPSGHTIHRLARALGCTVAELTDF